MYPTMASNAALSILFATALVSAFISTRASGSSVRRALSSDEADVLSICDHASFPKLCRALVPSLSHPMTATSLTEAAVQMAASKGEEAKAATNRYMAAPETTKGVKGALQVCYKSFDDATNNLKEAGKLLKDVSLHDKVMSNLQAALASLADCDDAFNEFPWVPSPVAHITKHMEKLTSNSLSLAIGAF